MKSVQLATKIDERIKKVLESVCHTKGLKMNRFIEDAILDKLEEMEDVEELKKIRKEKFRDFSDIISEFKNNGKL